MNRIFNFFKKYWNRIKKIIKYSAITTTSIFTFGLIFISDELILNKEKDFIKCDWMLKIDSTYKPLFYKSMIFICIFLILLIGFTIYYVFRFKIKISGNDYLIEIRYGDIFKIKNSIPVVHSDECLSSHLGEAPGDIKRSSIYGQYLQCHENLNILEIIAKNNVKPERARSKYNNQQCYRLGTILYNEDALILAFARLNKDGCAEFDSLEDYMNCLSYMWQEIRAKHGDKDVAISVLGSGRTKINGVSLSKQEIFDYFILSYKISLNKLQRNYKLIICCEREEISLDNIKVI